eukprot:5119392-Pleurochrysis_carterae.AAC.1
MHSRDRQVLRGLGMRRGAQNPMRRQTPAGATSSLAALGARLDSLQEASVANGHRLEEDQQLNEHVSPKVAVPELETHELRRREKLGEVDLSNAHARAIARVPHPSAEFARVEGGHRQLCSLSVPLAEQASPSQHQQIGVAMQYVTHASCNISILLKTLQRVEQIQHETHKNTPARIAASKTETLKTDTRLIFAPEQCIRSLRPTDTHGRHHAVSLSLPPCAPPPQGVHTSRDAVVCAPSAASSTSIATTAVAALADSTVSSAALLATSAPESCTSGARGQQGGADNH